MKIIKKLTINKPIEQVWDVLGNQFGEIDKWASLISHSAMSGESNMSGISHSIRSTETTSGPTKQELTAFNPDKHTKIYKLGLIISNTFDNYEQYILRERTGNEEKELDKSFRLRLSINSVIL